MTGLRKLMDSRKWQRMNDEAKMTAVKEEAAKAKKAVLEEMVRRRRWNAPDDCHAGHVRGMGLRGND